MAPKQISWQRRSSYAISSKPLVDRRQKLHAGAPGRDAPFLLNSIDLGYLHPSAPIATQDGLPYPTANLWCLGRRSPTRPEADLRGPVLLEERLALVGTERDMFCPPFPTPWRVAEMSGGYVVEDASGQRIGGSTVAGTRRLLIASRPRGQVSVP
jgi:hypothetical protein